MLRNKWIFLIFVSVTILFGCSLLDPSKAKSSINVPQQWNSSNKNFKVNSSLSAESLAQLYWWQQFHDPTLNTLIESALANNNDIKMAVAHLADAQGQLKQVKLSWVPTIPLMVGYSQMTVLNSPGYFLGLFPSYTFNIFGLIKAQEQAKYNVEASQYAIDSVRLTVIGQTAGSYFALSSQQYQLKLAKDLAKLYKARELGYQKQFELGLNDAKTVTEAASYVPQIEAQIAILENNIIVSQNALRYLANQNPGAVNGVFGFEKINTNSVIPGTLPVTVLANRPDINAAEAQLKADNANIGLAYSSYWPTIQLDDFMAQASQNGITNTGPMNMGEAMVGVPLLNLKPLGQIDSTKSRYAKSYYAYEKSVRRALHDVENDLSAHNFYSKRYTDLIAANQTIEQSCNNELSKFQNGLANYTSVVECQIKLTQASIAVAQSKLEKLTTIVALYQDLGGGYDFKKSNKLSQVP